MSFCSDYPDDNHGGYLVEDAFHFQPEVDPLDHRFEASHMMILDRMPAATADYSFQAVNDSAAFPGYSPQAPIYGNEVSQPSGYREFMRPQSIPLWPCNGVCPQPTNSPSGPICDHTTCNPPPDVGFLSRRFAENGNWIRARASAVASLAYKRRGFYSLPIDIVEMIPGVFPTLNPLTSRGFGEGILQFHYRHAVIRALAATSTRLRVIFHERSWNTRVISIPTLPRFLLHPETPRVFALHLKRLIVRFPDSSEYMIYLRECLGALPSLHTLEILDREDLALDRTFKINGSATEVFKRGDFPSIKKVTIPQAVHPILSRLPNIQELVCFGHRPGWSVKSVLSSVRGPYLKENTGETDPVLKSFTVISDNPDYRIAEALAKKFPRLRRVCLSKPRPEDIKALRNLKEITELEILVVHSRGCASCDVNHVKPLAIQILQASECHKGCVCNYGCGCAETNDCDKCKPPKRFLRIRTCPRSYVQDDRVIIHEGPYLEEIEVSPRRVLSAE